MAYSLRTTRGPLSVKAVYSTPVLSRPVPYVASLSTEALIRLLVA